MRCKYVYPIIVFLWIPGATNFIGAQTGGTYDLSHSVIAGGGGNQSNGSTFTVDGTVGQNLAGTVSTGGVYNLRGGFWTSPPLAPTAAVVSVSGRIRTAEGQGIRNVWLTLTNPATGESFPALSTSFGYYRFEEIPAGRTYILAVTSRRYTFDPAIRVINVLDEITDVDFTALPN